MKTKAELLIAEFLEDQKENSFPIGSEDFFFDYMTEDEQALFGSLEAFERAIEEAQ